MSGVITCPCCGSILTSEMSADGVPSLPGFTVTERKILVELARKYPNFVTMPSLVDAVYWSDVDGGPDTAEMVIRTLLSKIRRKLPSFGWSVPSGRAGRGNYGQYRLERVEVAK